MRGVILATGYGDALHDFHPDLPAALAPVVDRPFVHHVVERLIDLGVRRFDVVLSERPEAVEKALGNGRRWGSRITYHLARDLDRPFHVLRLLAPDLEEDVVWLADAHRLPECPDALRQWKRPGGAPVPAAVDTPRSFTRDRISPVLLEGPEGGWCGWAVVTTACLSRIPGDLVLEALPVWMADCTGHATKRVRVPQVLDVRTPAELMAANQTVLRGVFRGILPDAWEHEPGVRVGRQTAIHPSATLKSPVLIGDRVSVGEGAVVGPGAVLGAGSMVEARSTVRESVLYPGTYVGEDVDVVGALVRRNRLFKAEDGTRLDVPDAFLLGGLAPEPGNGRRGTRLTDRLIALAMLGLTAPIWLAAWLWRGFRHGRPAVEAREVVRVPAPEDRAAWQTFSLRAFEHGWGRKPGVVSARERLHRLPALWNVVRGDMALVGLPPRTPAEVATLPEAWRQVYLRSRPGWITLRDVTRGASESPDDAFATEAYQAAHGGGLLDLRILGRWVF